MTLILLFGPSNARLLLELVVNSAMIFRFKSTEIEQFLATKEVSDEKVEPHSLHRKRVFFKIEDSFMRMNR